MSPATPRTTRFESFVQLLSCLRDPLLLASDDGRILAANAASADALGTTVAALEGAALSTFSPAPGILAERLRGNAQEITFALRARDGRRCLCDTRRIVGGILLVRLSGGLASAPRARAFLEELSTAHVVTDATSIVDPETDVAHALLGRSIDELGAIGAVLFLLDRAGNDLEIVSSAGNTEEAPRFRLIPLTTPVPIVDAFKRGVSVFLGTAEALEAGYPEAVRLLPRLVERALACVPLEEGGKTIGALALAFPMPWTFDEERRARIGAFARECASALDGVERIEREEAARAPIERATSHLERMHAFSSTLARAVTPAALVEAIVEAGLVAATASTCTLFLVSKDGKTVCPAHTAGDGAPTSDTKSELPIDQPLRTPILDALRDGTPVWIESAHQLEDRYPHASPATASDPESALACVPMFAEGRAIGALQFRWEDARRFFEDERAFLRVLARSAGQAVVRTRLYAVEQRAKEVAEASKRRSDLLAQASTLLGSSLDYSVTLAALVQAVVPSFADWCTVELEEEARRGAPPLVSHVDPAKAPLILELIRAHHERGDAADRLTTVTRTGVSQLFVDLTVDRIRAGVPNPEPLIPLYESLGLTATILVPITARGRTLGAMALNLATTERRYDVEDVKAAEELGRRIGVAIDNARLFRDAREIDRKKDEFLAMLGHELRNPLAPILAALDVMHARDPEAFANERAIVSRHVRHLVRLVDDLLDVSRVTRGIIQLDKARFATADIVAEAVETANPLIQENGHRLTVSAAPGLDVIVDRVRLSQAIGNLLLNAAKYTEPGGEISVTAFAEGSDAVIRVRDTGCGIAQETLPRVFDLFVQGDRTLDRARGGLGIGLTVVKGIVELLGGSVSAHSEGVGRGTEMVVRIPLAPPLTVVTPPLPSSAPVREAEAPLAVLVVDDNEDAALMVEATLEILGCTAKIAHTGASALAAIATFTPDLVLLDIGLPDIDGYEVARRLRREPAVASARIVAVTGYAQESARRQSKEAGCDEHVVKPIGLDELSAIVARSRTTR